MSEIDDKYNVLGGSGGFLGEPVDVERPTPNGLGRYRHYQAGSIYWHNAVPAEAFVVYGLIRKKWSEMGWERSPVGFPISDELPADDSGRGRISFFDGGAIVYHPDLGTFETHGAIFRRWRDLGGARGLGYPLTDELTTPDNRGRYNHFERGSIYWTPETGAWEVSAAIKDEWASRGWEQSPLSYPVDSSRRMPGVLTDFQDFEHGTIYAFGSNAKALIFPGNHIFGTSEHFIGWEDFGQTLPDEDIITVNFSQNLPQAGISLTLNAGSNVTWWKGLSLYTPTRGDFQEIFTEGRIASSTTTLDPSSFDNDVYLHFKKAKAFGIHTGMYLLSRPDRLIGTHATFTWLKDG